MIARCDGRKDIYPVHACRGKRGGVRGQADVGPIMLMHVSMGSCLILNLTFGSSRSALSAQISSSSSGSPAEKGLLHHLLPGPFN